MSSTSWPPQLKEWVAKCLGQMTDSNRTEAQAELRQVIADAFAANTLWTTDWGGIQLQSLLPKPAITLKRKTVEQPSPSTKKSKKHKQTPATDYNDQLALNRRAERFQREHEIERQKQRFGAHTTMKANPLHSHLLTNSRSASPMLGGSDEAYADPNVIDWDRFTIVGTSKEIFKNYLRLTSEPKPEQIRPFEVLKQTLVELKKKWRQKESYDWICNQFKSLRQDLTVQRIKNEFTVEVYEQHARMALEHSDMVEYNACQAMLKTLYELGIPGKVSEFTAYQILFLLHGRNTSELNLYVGQLTPKQKSDPAVQHALNVQKSQAIGNYHRLFELYLSAPNMGAYIMDHFIDRERVKALIAMAKAYRTVSLSFIAQELAWDTIEEARDFLIAQGAAFFTNPNSPDTEKELECKPTVPQLTRSFEEKYRKVGIKGAI